jgi:hypothetical protein
MAGWVRKNGHMTITILSIAHMGIPNKERKSIYWAIPTVLVDVLFCD